MKAQIAAAMPREEADNRRVAAFKRFDEILAEIRGVIEIYQERDSQAHIAINTAHGKILNLLEDHGEKLAALDKGLALLEERIKGGYIHALD